MLHRMNTIPSSATFAESRNPKHGSASKANGALRATRQERAFAYGSRDD